MGLDIRLPIGLLFLALGAILTGAGLFADHEIYARSDNINVNLYWGLLLLVFGMGMGFFGMRGTAALRTRLAMEEGRRMHGAEEYHGGEP